MAHSLDNKYKGKTQPSSPLRPWHQCEMFLPPGAYHKRHQPPINHYLQSVRTHKVPLPPLTWPCRWLAERPENSSALRHAVEPGIVTRMCHVLCPCGSRKSLIPKVPSALLDGGLPSSIPSARSSAAPTPSRALPDRHHVDGRPVTVFLRDIEQTLAQILDHVFLFSFSTPSHSVKGSSQLKQASSQSVHLSAALFCIGRDSSLRCQ